MTSVINNLITPTKYVKHKVAILLGYTGSRYHGSQYNEHWDIGVLRPTIEGELFRALSKTHLISKENASDFRKCHFQRTTRTDKGVHALSNVISLKLVFPKDQSIVGEEVSRTINEYLPENIRVWDVQRVNKKFNARKACGWRQYEYILPSYLISLNYREINELLELTLKDSFEESDSIRLRNTPSLNIKSLQDILPSVDLYLKEVTSKVTNIPIIPQRLIDFKGLMKMFVGTFDFHNYTSGTMKNLKPGSTTRHIIDVDVSHPYHISNAPGEWISVFIQGQSFLLHQIRRMISMGIMCLIWGKNSKYIAYSLQKNCEIIIPKIPSLGLTLNETDFTSYNKKLLQLGYDPIDFHKYPKQMAEFKINHIRNDIFANERDSKEFIKYMHYICFSQKEGFPSI